MLLARSSHASGEKKDVMTAVIALFRCEREMQLT
jgi:hypothetical protein